MKSHKIDDTILAAHGWVFVEWSQRRNIDEHFYHTKSKTKLDTYNEVLDWIIDNHATSLLK